MKLNIFKAEMFTSYDYRSNTPILTRGMCAEQANEILNKYIEENGVRVFGQRSHYGLLNMNEYADPENGPSDSNTHTGILINVQEIKKKCEKHEPDRISLSSISAGKSQCKHCNAKLQAEWKEVE